MKQQRDLSGMLFGRLLAITSIGRSGGHTTWLCRCDCGEAPIVRGTHLTGELTESCGCLRSELTSARSRTHGKSKTRTYRIWRNMINRCHWDKWPEWHLYGGRGIFVCQEWRDSFEAFMADMGEAPKDRGIDRFPDGDGPYRRGNCRWATPKEQANNRRKPSKVYNDEKL